MDFTEAVKMLRINQPVWSCKICGQKFHSGTVCPGCKSAESSFLGGQIITQDIKEGLTMASLQKDAKKFD
ncbi:MAG: hypothetical protein KAQ63_01045 [Candidatus Moranbacteria bacterium]|nr:hypothetical protein [Candidatus Moranbacteria bacterium]